MKINFNNFRFNIVTLLTALFAALCFAACSQTDNTVEEFPNWQHKNDTYWTKLYNDTKKKIDAGDTSWRLILNYSKDGQHSASDKVISYNPTDYIIVNVKKSGTASQRPIYTDSVSYHCQGRIIPSVKYTSGLIFEQSWTGKKFDNRLDLPFKNYVRTCTDGLATALQNMHLGDHWTVYVPYQLGYGSTDKGNIPPYSILIYDVTLVDIIK